jgi:hypothetical protein
LWKTLWKSFGAVRLGKPRREIGTDTMRLRNKAGDR